MTRADSYDMIILLTLAGSRPNIFAGITHHCRYYVIVDDLCQPTYLPPCSASVRMLQNASVHPVLQLWPTHNSGMVTTTLFCYRQN